MGDLQPPPRPFTGPLNPEKTYYDRQSRVTGWGPEGQRILSKSSVLIVGAGGLGCPAALYLAGAGVGRLGIADPDRVSLSNLPRQTLFSPGDIGRNKAAAAAEFLKNHNPYIMVEALEERIGRDNLREHLAKWDLVVDGSDNFETRFLLHDGARAAGKPLVTASLHQWEGQIQVFDFRTSQPGCLRCLYPQAPEDGCVANCADIGVAGALAGILGSHQALAAVQLLLGLGGLRRGESLLYDFRDWSSHKLRWKPDPLCPCCGHPPSWDFLKAIPPAPREGIWENLSPEQWPVVADLRPSEEIQPQEWDFLQAAGFRVISLPLSSWLLEGINLPEGLPPGPILLVCRTGVRSHALQKEMEASWPGRFLSLAGGMEGLERLL